MGESYRLPNFYTLEELLYTNYQIRLITLQMWTKSIVFNIN